MRFALIVISLVIALECATLFVVFVPVVHETAEEPCFMSTCTQAVLVFDYYGSISFHYFNVGMVYGACGGFQMATSPNRSPDYC
jgi:hypothetical protein